MPGRSKEELETVARQKIEESRIAVAKSLNKLSSVEENFGWIFENMPWDSMIEYDLKEAMAKLGTLLAALDTWYEDE